jgi:hypothetical protein
MSPALRTAPLALLAALALASCDEGESAVQSLEGTWNVVGYAESGIEAVASGTALFGADRTVSLVYDVTFPGQGTVSVFSSGTWTQSGSTVSMVLDGAASSWTVSFSGNFAVLEQVGGAQVVFVFERTSEPGPT